LSGRGTVDEAMENPFGAVEPGGECGEGIVESGALVDDAIEAELSGDLELLLEESSLFGDELVVEIGGLLRGRGGETIAINTGFTDGDDFGVSGERGEIIADVIGGFGGVVWMPTDGGEDFWILLGDGDATTAAFEVGADGDDSSNASLFGAIEKLGEIVLELGKVQVRVGIVEDRGRHG